MAGRGPQEEAVAANFGPGGSASQRGGKQSTRDGVSVFLLSTHHIPHALRPYASATSVSTRLIKQCLENYRDAILLAREYGHKTEAERMRFHAHLLKLKRQQLVHKETKGGENDATSVTTTTSLGVEKQIWNLVLRDFQQQPILLSESMQYRQALQDMNEVARGVLVPLELLRHRTHWLLIQEDVPLNLADRFLHYRVVVRRSPSVELAERLWRDLWSLLGAVWRQRERLMGVYGKGMPPVDIDGDTSRLPPSLSVSPSWHDTYCEKKGTYDSRHAMRDVRSGDDVKTMDMDNDANIDTSDADDCAFGPLLPHRVGITVSRHHAIRTPLLSLLRSLRVRVWATASAESLRMSCDDCGDGDIAQHSDFLSSCKNVGFEASSVRAGEGTVLHNVSFFDTTVEDVEACRAPYISPQKFLQLRLKKKGDTSEWDGAAVVHSYSDDAWNIAVLTVEFMLTGFPLAESCCGHPDHCFPPTPSLFDDVVKLLVVCHKVPLEAAQNFIYAALHELSLLLLKRSTRLLRAEENDDCLQLGPQPQFLAQQWYLYLCEVYGDCSSVGGSVLFEVAKNGLRWSRRERWEAFQAAHALVLREKDDVRAAGGGDADGGGGLHIDATRRVRGGLKFPLLPLHPLLCTAAAKTGAGVESFLQDLQSSLSFAQPSFLSLQELWVQLRVWRNHVERHAVVDGGCLRDDYALQTVVFWEFVRVVRRALQLQLRETKQEDKKGEEGTQRGTTSGSGHCGVTTHMETFSTQRDEPPQRAVQHELFRGLLERAALFSYRTDGSYLHEGSHVDDDDDDFLQVFSFSRVFLPTTTLLWLLCNDVRSLRASSPTSAGLYKTLDVVVGAKRKTSLCASSFSSLEAKKNENCE